MVVPWMAYSIWKIWVIHVLVFLVFHVFSTAELIFPCKTVNLAVWAFSSIFLHDFTLFGIDMIYIYHISLIATTFGALWKMTFLGQKCIPILGMRLTWFQCLKKIIVGAHGSQIRHLWPRWPSPNVLVCLLSFHPANDSRRLWGTSLDWGRSRHSTIVMINVLGFLGILFGKALCSDIHCSFAVSSLFLRSSYHLVFKNISHHGSFQGFHGRELCGANKWIGLDGMDWDLCVGLLYEHRFVVLMFLGIWCAASVKVVDRPNMCYIL